MNKSILNAICACNAKDDSPRGHKTVSNSEVKPGDKVICENRFTLVIDDPETEAAETETTTRNPEEVTAAIIEYFEENGDTFADCIEELDSYNGYLGDDRYYSMNELDEFYHDTDPSEILRRAFYGHDAETYTTNSNGDREYGAFNPNRDYFTYNGYGNLVSADYKDYSDKLDRYVVEEMSENRYYINSIESDDDLAALFDELEEAQADEE